jgi:hypothetical protein
LDASVLDIEGLKRRLTVINEEAKEKDQYYQAKERREERMKEYEKRLNQGVPITSTRANPGAN